ncbi:ABC transporter ATP-binding protein [Swaminathania salitolerans]|uniref:ABC transporter ATP-binding protein n=1 Tax=Swaminathania salitolerans TaxID=182838 RepID=A0A511BRR2_9PROT|nr:peptide ABC transporter ATP-binding protein [Swaminathania salitolerans LMG 21291]GEL03009.1 ABC transporter ATP-binding protein [Swaminathania salitolerans]
MPPPVTPPPTIPLLQAHSLSKSFALGRRRVWGEKRFLTAVDDVSLSLGAGDSLALVGESGCGKSTLGRLLMGFDAPDRGRVMFEGQDLARLRAGEKRRLRARVQMVFQDSGSSFNPRRSIGATLAEPYRIHGRAWSRAAIEALLEQVGLSASLYERHPVALSGGQRQRLNIARALALSPRLVVADEPVSALDVSVQAQIVNLLRRLQSELGLASVFISHDLAVVRQIADRMAVMYLGSLVEEGETLATLARPLHPYTRALVEAVPRPGRALVAPLEGDVPDAVSPPGGCRFHTRCPVARPLCAQERPKLETMGQERKVACHFPLV